MKKNQPIKRSRPSDSKQDIPFTHYQGFRYAEWADPKTEEIPLETVANGIRRSSVGDDQILTYLILEYKEVLKTESPEDSIDNLLSSVDRLFKNKILSMDERLIIIKAMSGDFKATQLLIKANPETIYLPFIADNMIKLLREYKDKPIPKGANLVDIKDKWMEFLSQRPGGKIPYRNEDIQHLFNHAKKLNMPSDEAYEKIAELLDISEDSVKRRIKTKTKRGRPKKIQ